MPGGGPLARRRRLRRAGGVPRDRRAAITGVTPSRRTLVVLAGPIGCGKSTVAAKLGHLVAAAGKTAAVADLDDVAFAQRGPLDIPELCRRAGIAHVRLVQGCFEAGVDVVIAHGPFFQS